MVSHAPPPFRTPVEETSPMKRGLKDKRVERALFGEHG